MIALGALGYKIACTVYYWDSISMWWARTIAMFFVLYITSLATAFTTFTRGIATPVMSGIIIFISLTFLIFDGIMMLGFIASLDDSSLVEYGIFPLVNLLNAIAGVFDLIGFFRLKKRTSSQILGEYAQPTL